MRMVCLFPYHLRDKKCIEKAGSVKMKLYRAVGSVSDSY